MDGDDPLDEFPWPEWEKKKEATDEEVCTGGALMILESMLAQGADIDYANEQAEKYRAECFERRRK